MMGQSNVDKVEAVFDGIVAIIKFITFYGVVWFFVSFANASWNPLNWVWWAQIIMATPFIVATIYFIADSLPDDE